MLNHLNWDTLQQRRLRTKAIMMYRIINGLVAIEPPPFMHHLGALNSDILVKLQIIAKVQIIREFFVSCIQAPGTQLGRFRFFFFFFH
jgi:hypothetical protein